MDNRPICYESELFNSQRFLEISGFLLGRILFHYWQWLIYGKLLQRFYIIAFRFLVALISILFCYKRLSSADFLEQDFTVDMKPYFQNHNFCSICRELLGDLEDTDHLV